MGPAKRSARAPDDVTISVIIPSYNHAAFIRDAIRSVDRQRYPYIQLVIIDDGSGDDSVRIIQETLADISIRDVIFEVQANTGAHQAINRGIALSRGAYIAILNSDDLYHPERLSRLHEFLSLHRLELAFTQPMVWEGDAPSASHARLLDVWYSSLICYPALSWSLLRMNGCYTSSNLLFRRRLLERVGPFRDFTLVHDFDFVLRCMAESEPGLLAEPLVLYRLHAHNTITTRHQHERAYAEYRTIIAAYFDLVRTGSIRNPQAPGYVADHARFRDLLLLKPPFTLPFANPDTIWRASGMDLARTQASLTPPSELLALVGSLTPADYHAVGAEFVRYFIELADLQPDATVLDIGCGSGRIAISLTAYLDASARYEGFDIVPSAINWCVDNITPHFANFRFQLADVHNRFYNPDGKARAADYVFPYADRTFDFIFLTSVFTHVLPDELERYIAEIARVLKPGGSCLATFFLENEESLACLSATADSLPLTVQQPGYRVISPDQPELAVCYPETGVLSTFQAHGLELQLKMQGSWCGRNTYLSFQDILMVRKPIECDA